MTKKGGHYTTVGKDGATVSLTQDTEIDFLEGSVDGTSDSFPRLLESAQYIYIETDVAVRIQLDEYGARLRLGANQAREIVNHNVRVMKILGPTAGAPAAVWIFASVDEKIMYRRVV